MKPLLKKFLNISLSLFLLGNGFHISHFEHSHASSEYSFCDSECTNKDCSSSTHECQQCLKESNRFLILSPSNHLEKLNESTLLFTDYASSRNTSKIKTKFSKISGNLLPYD